MSSRFETTSAVTLQHEIKKLGPKAIGVELGVWTGHNFAHLLDECTNIEFMYGIDPYKPYQDWNRYIDESIMENAQQTAVNNMSFFPNRCKLLKTTSHEASVLFKDNSLDFIFIDGDHSYDCCYNDLNWWYKKIRRGGLFSGHDFSLPGVNKALLQFRTENNITGFFKVIPNDVWFWIKD